MIWYLDHSAIAVETNNHLLLFDLFGKTLQPPKGMGLAQGFVNPDELRDKDVVIFVSHEHPDHFDPAIFSLRDRLKRVRFVLPEEFDEIYQGDLFAAPNQTYRLPDMTVTTFESTDIGLAYLVEVDDKRIYHAGDLNWWHWEGEEEEFNLDQAKRYQQQMQLLADALDGNHLDLDLACIGHNLGNRAIELSERTVGHLHRLTDLEVRGGLLRSLAARALHDLVVLVARERRRVAVGTHEAGHARSVANRSPAAIVKLHADEHVAREHLLLALDATAALFDLGDHLSRDLDAEDVVLETHRFDARLEVLLDLVLVS